MDTAPRQCYSCPSDGLADPPEPRFPHHTGWGRAQATLGTGTGGSRAAETVVSRSLPPCYLPRRPSSVRASPGWCRRRTPWCSTCKAGCAWDTQRWHAGLGAVASCGHHTCSHSTHSLGDTRLRGSVEKPEGLSQGAPGPLGAPLFLYPQPSPTHLKGLPTEVTATKLALEAPLGAVVLQVCGQVAAAQLGGAAIGAGDDIEAAGVQVALVGKTVVSA